MVGEYGENIYVEFDYNNISIVDPNKIIDENGIVRERHIRQENLVMYANLECKLVPRTKLILGTSYTDAQQISLASINFLKQQDKQFLDNSYTDEFTGKDVLKGQGVNQVVYNKVDVKKENKPDDYYFNKNINSNGKLGSVNNGLLGIQSISVRIGMDFQPQVDIGLVDVKGRALFELGDNSPYAAFFNMPYPKFELTLKGWMGKAVKYSLMLQDFKANFIGSTGNFNISLKFLPYKYTILSEISMGMALSLPNMYQTNVSIKSSENTENFTTEFTSTNSSTGREKLSEVYSEYKSKGLIDENMKELTLLELRANIDRFASNVMTQFTKQNLAPLTEVKKFLADLKNFGNEIYVGDDKTAWSKIYLDQKNFYILKDDTRIYVIKPELRTAAKISEANTKLEQVITTNKTKLLQNPVLGKNGSYEVVGKTKKVVKSEITNVDLITPEIFRIDIPDLSKNIDLEKTYKKRNSSKQTPNKQQLETLKDEVSKLQLDLVKIIQDPETQEYKLKNENLFYLLNKSEGKVNSTGSEVILPNKTIIELFNQISIDVKKKKQEIENALTEALAEYLKSSGSEGLGFIPSIRNVLSVFYANAEAFLRLMDEVHQKAWEQRDNKNRKGAVLDSETKSANPDYLEGGDTPIYPWPSFVVPGKGKDGQEIFELKYPGDKDYIKRTKADDFSIWPEVEFVENFLEALLQTKEDIKTPPSLNDEVTDVKRIGLNAIEFPISNRVYQNKEETKFFYEIWERIYLVSFYSMISRSQENKDDYQKILQTLVSMEVQNLQTVLNSNSPSLTFKLKNLQISSSNIEQILSAISNQGQGASYQTFIRGRFNTPYIRNILENSQTRFLDVSELSSPSAIPSTTVDLKPITEFITDSTSTNNFLLTDLQPFVIDSWTKKYLAYGKNIDPESAFNTKNTLFYLDSNKIISNFLPTQNKTVNRPVTTFNYENGQQNLPPVKTISFLSDFYPERKIKDQVITEGNLDYFNYSGGGGQHQTTSILNTPFFVNAIQEGVENSLTNSTFPYTSAAYLFLNSLPIATLKEPLKSLVDGDLKTSGYIFASLKKFAAIHRLPYAFILKIGSIWHRYKTFVQTGNDILDNCWKNFDYIGNFDPDTKNIGKFYQITQNNINYDIMLEREVTFEDQSYTSINVGFYPKTINDFSYFLRGSFLFTGYTSNDIQQNLTTGTTKSGLNLFLINNASIRRREGFDKKNPKRSLGLTSWNCAIYDATENKTYTVPSLGSFVNQTELECFDGKTLTEELSGNTSVYNGSVRLFWSAPQYGYFNVGKVKKPLYNEYMKFVNPSEKEQQNFSINGENIEYSKIDEIFSIFDKQTLDSFSSEFLNFCRSENTLILEKTTTVGDETKTSEISQDTIDNGFTNFQILMKNLLGNSNVTGNTSNELLESFQSINFKNLSSFLKSFMDYDKLFLYGNPSFFNRRLFTSFSGKFIIDPEKWTFYNELTPTALPSKGGSITLETSKSNYPQEWIDLELYVGFSEIDQLRYKNSSDGGSFITDFFIDYNVAFTSENIKKFASIIKIYATQKLKQFLKDPVDPIATPVQKRDIFSTANLSGGSVVTVYRTKSLNKIATINDVSGKLLYTGKKSTQLTPRQLTENAIVDYYKDQAPLYPIINFQQVKDPSFSETPKVGNFDSQLKFKTSMTDFLSISENLKNDIINQVFAELNKILPDTETTTEQKINSVLQGDQAKYDQYSSFKAINDKWISGNDFKVKTLFEDVLLIDRASKNIGDKLYIDVFKLKSYLSKPNVTNTVLDIVRSIIKDNSFVIMDLPSYVNYYNVQDVVKNPVPKPEGTLTFGNTLFGTFLNVDYRESSAKMVCFYGGRKSEHLNTGTSSRYKDDTFNIRRASDNPLSENLSGKKDWALSNKLIAFNVDVGPQSQSIFKDLNVGMNSGQATAESMQIAYDIRNSAVGIGAAPQSVSQLNTYKTRSYEAGFSMMGNALIQPTMYFNLRHVPLFSGPYMITSVNHSISDGKFDTNITGQRQALASQPLPADYLQSLKQNLISKVEEAIKQVDETNNLTSENNITKTSNTATKVLDKILNPVTANCADGLNEVYKKDFKQVENTLLPTNKVNFKDCLTTINEIVDVLGLNQESSTKLKQIVFCSIYLTSVNKVKKGFEANYNNFAAIDLTYNWGAIENEFDPENPKQYICLKTQNGSLKPYATFESLKRCVEFLAKRFNPRVQQLPVGELKKEQIIEFWTVNLNPDSKEGKKQYDSLNSVDKANMETKADEALSKYKSLTI
jgi:hypothetical protein